MPRSRFLRGRPGWASAVAALAAVLTLLAPVCAPTPGTVAISPSTTQFDLRQAPADAAAAAALVEPAVVRIGTRVDYQGVVGLGTGIVLDPSGEVLTNYHVVQGADAITAHSVGTGQNFPVDLIGYDRRSDVALVRLRGAGGLPAAPIGDSSSVAIGDQVVSIGNADGPRVPLTREVGPVTALNRTIVANDELTGGAEQVTGLIEVAAPVRPGDSGGPLVSAAGQVIGLTTAATVDFQLNDPGGEGFAIPINRALDVAGQIRSGTPSDSVHIGQPALLGVGIGGLPAGVGAGRAGALIRDVITGAPAAQAGVRKGDVIAELDGAPVDSPSTLSYLLDRHYPGDTVTLTLVDPSGQRRTAAVTLISAGAG
jgi:serine protease Do